MATSNIEHRTPNIEWEDEWQAALLHSIKSNLVETANNSNLGRTAVLPYRVLIFGF
jgi:hypothetical protein